MAKKNTNGKNKRIEKKQPSAKNFPHFILLPLLIMFIISLISGTGYSLLISANKTHDSQLKEVEFRAQVLAQQVNNTIKLLEQTVSSAASSESFISTLADGSPDKIEQLSAQLNALTPYSLKTRIIARGTVKADSKSHPPITFSTVDMVQKTETGDVVSPEAFKADGRHILNWARPIKNGEHILGTLLVSVDLNALIGQTGANIDKNSSVQLVQQFQNGSPLVLFSHGNKQLSESPLRIEQDTNNPHWKIIYSTAQANTVDTLLALMTPIMVTFLLGAAVAFISFRIVEKQLRLDSARLIAHLEELKFGQYSKPPRFNVLFMETLDHTLERLFTDHQEEMTAPLQNSQESVETSVPTAAAKDTPKPNNEHHDEQDSPSELDLPESLQTSNAIPVKEFPGHGLPSAEVDDQLELPDIPAGIFRAYDIRGIVNEGITEDTIRLLGKSIGSEALEKGEQSIFVGQDGRLSSPTLSTALVEGLLSTGIDVINIGIVPTPVLWFACHTEESSRSGVMVTGSHNPANYNGLKIMIAGDTLSGDSVSALRDRLIRNAIQQGKGSETNANFKEKYINHIAEDVILATPMTVVLDCGNGSAGEIAPAF
ncbi:MAG: hypothetical protein JKY01_05465 [Pseudomonadales bacterium]|nr:hypothetical protein [Pseudomonadales bacterium]